MKISSSVDSMHGFEGVVDNFVENLMDDYGIDLIAKVMLGVKIEGNNSEVANAISKCVNQDIVKTRPLGSFLVVQFDTFVVYFELKPSYSVSQSFVLNIYGDINEVDDIKSKLKSKFSIANSDSIAWAFLASGGLTIKDMDLHHPYSLKNEFVPWIKPSIKEFGQEFMNSSSNILLLMGEPGSGKTSFVRELIREHNLKALVTYDEELMIKDSFYIQALEIKDSILVVEDADVLLKSRKAGNKVMNKILNASDGLIKTQNKIIFTANITDVDEIDEALLRKGRCFDILHFRPLTHSEAKAAAMVANLPEPDGPRTLAELFDDHICSPQPTSSFGFGF